MGFLRKGGGDLVGRSVETIVKSFINYLEEIKEFDDEIEEKRIDGYL